MSAPPVISLSQWIWRAFAQSALIPLVLVETVLIAIYLLSNNAIRDAQIEHLRQTALSDLQASARIQTRIIDGQLMHIEALTNTYRNLTQRALLQPASGAPKLAITPSGAQYSPHDNGGAAFFYSTAVPAAQHDPSKLAQLATLDPLMREFKQGNPLVASLYFNSWDSLNHIYPWFKTQEQYPHDMVIPDYNFYYLADAAHNPQRKVVWTNVYLDPAGQGWMMSAIAPVYRDNFLQGVSGVDITVDGILSQIDQLEVPWNGYAMLVSEKLNIMALPKTGEYDFELSELSSHSSEQAIRQEVFKPEDFNLANHELTRTLAAAVAAQPQGVLSVVLAGHRHLIAWATIERTGWHLLAVVDEAQVFSQTNFLASRYQQIGYLLIAGLVLFYLLFFTFMWLRARRLGQHLLRPIAGISTMMAAIGKGQWQPERVTSDICELDDMAVQAAQMGSTLAQSESRNHAAQQRLELVLEGATESLWECNFDTGLVHLRGRFGQRFGFPEETLREEDFLQRVHPDDVESIHSAVQRVREGRSQSYEAEFRFADAAGNYAWLLGRGRVLEYDPQTGLPRVLAGTDVDIDALKASQAALRQATQEAQTANQAKSRFISSMSHELRTPLNAIQGFAQLIRMGDLPPTKQSQYLEEILSAGQHLNQLVGDILDWSSVQAQKPQLELQAVDITTIMSECADLVRLEVMGHGLQFNVDLPSLPLQARAEPRRLRQVLLNLLSNAMKYNRPNGQITFSYQLLDGHIRLLVNDTGLGISTAQQALLFEPFQRLGRENTSIQGTGIGLSLCREYANLMDASIGIHSEPGVGSSFWIELRRLEPGVVPANSPRVAHIFYADNDTANQQAVCSALAGLGRVSVAGDARLALGQLLSDPADVLLLDLDLPGMAGEELFKQLRSNPQTAAMPVVLMAAGMSAEVAAAAVNCQGLLSKPLDLNELHGLVEALLSEVLDDAE